MPCHLAETEQYRVNYLEGIWAAPEAGSAGTEAAETGAMAAAFSSTLVELVAGRAEPK